MKKVLLTAGIVLAAQSLFAQVWFTKTGAVSFFSHTSIEDIKAENNEVVSFIDGAKGEFRFQLLIKGFRFPKASMQDHFNDANYMNSDQFPKAEFKGSIVNTKAVDFKKDGTYKVEVSWCHDHAWSDQKHYCARHHYHQRRCACCKRSVYGKA